MFYKFTPPRHLTLQVHAKPGARLTKLVPHGTGTGSSIPQLNIMLSARPVEGAANVALCEFLAQVLKARKSDVQVVAGLTSRDKVVRVELRESMTEEQVRVLMEGLVEEAE